MVAETNERFGFITTTRSIREFLIESGQGCYIPAYQRLYAWDDKNISRLLEDVLHGIREIVHRSDTITFIGTIIAIHDTTYKTVKPLYKPELPSRVMTIIDGQQRICTAIMANVVFHNYIRGAVEEFSGKTEPPFSWISDKCRQLLEDLKKTYVIEQDSGQENYRYYPRVIRAYLDAWSRKRNQAEYESPIAKLIWEYINFAELGNFHQFRFNPVDSTGNIIDLYNMVYEGFRYIQREVMQICRMTSDNQYDFPDLVAAVQNSNFPEEILGFSLPEGVRKYITEEKEDSHYIQFCYLFRLMILARYLNNRVVIALVTASNESENGAFNMFEGLNTTAQPLTAFETFKPEVVKLETLSRYEDSPSKRYITEIESYLDQYKKADERQSATSEMLISFALAETGKRLEKNLNSQRRYLRNEFDQLNNIDQRRDFVKSIANISSFIKYGWNIREDQNSIFYPLEVEDEEALVGFGALRKLNHSITIAPLARFYQDAMSASGNIRKHRTDEFIAAIKATVAFSFLWRGMKGGTDKIDSHYRSIMRAGVNIQGETTLPLARRPEESESLSTVANYKKALQLILEHKGKISKKKEWVNQVSLVNVYGYPTVARFLLFCASDDTIPDNSNKGLIKRGRRGCNPMLKLSQWNDSAYLSIEHIAPQSQNAGWQLDIYEEDQTVHTLGNLVLLPHEENNIIDNKSWKHKQLMYTLLAADTQKEFDSIKTKLAAEGLTLSKKADEVLSKSQYLGLCKSVALFNKPWSLKIIQKRTQRFAELAWDRLYPWLFS